MTTSFGYFVLEHSDYGDLLRAEYMYCNWGDCCMKEDMTWDKLQNVRNEIKDNAMDMIKANLDIK